MGRAPCCDKTKVKRGPWSPDEDTILKNYINNHGTGGNWIALPHKAGLNRCGKSCRLRWLNYLRPDIKHGGFTVEEDNIILTLYHNIGSRWSIMASHLPGRTDNDIKNYWNTKLKKKVLRETRSSPTSTTIATTATSTTTTTIDATNNADNYFNHATPSTLTTEKMETNYVGSSNSNNMSPYYPMQDSTKFPLPRLVEVLENGINSYSGFPAIPLSPKLPSFSPSFSLDNIGLISTTCSIDGGGEDYNFFDEFNYKLAYDILFDLDVQENTSEFNPSITTSSDHSFAG